MAAAASDRYLPAHALAAVYGWSRDDRLADHERAAQNGVQFGPTLVLDLIQEIRAQWLENAELRDRLAGGKPTMEFYATVDEQDSGGGQLVPIDEDAATELDDLRMRGRDKVLVRMYDSETAEYSAALAH